MKKILFPTDLSPTSLNAFAFVLHLAQKINAEILTLHVYEFQLGVPVDNFDFLIDYYQIGAWGVFENFKGEVPKLRAIAEEHHLENISLSHLLERGNAVDEIVKCAAREEVDLIIMGTKGATGLKEIFLGTITEKVLKESKRFVIAVPLNYHYKPVQKILFLAEYKNLELELLQKVSDFAQILQARVQVLEVQSHPDGVNELMMRKWKEYFENGDFTFYYINKNFSERIILEFIGQHGINMVVITMRKKNFIEKLFTFSLSKQLVFHTTVPLLGIPS